MRSLFSGKPIKLPKKEKKKKEEKRKERVRQSNCTEVTKN